MVAQPKKKPVKEKPIPITKVQNEFNKMIRERDGECVTCGSKEKLQASHFFAVGSCSGLRFHPDNVHAQCASCHFEWHHRNTMPYTRYMQAHFDIEKLEAQRTISVKYGKLQRKNFLELIRLRQYDSLKKYIEMMQM